MLQPRLLMSHWIGTPALAMQVQLGAELHNRCMGHVKLLVKHALCSPAFAGWNMTSFDKGPGSGAFPSPTQARMGGLERTQPVVPAPTHRGPAAPSVMASQSQPSLPTTLESQATAGPRGGHGRNVPGLSPAFQRPEGARAGARQSVDMGAAARPQQRSSLQARASADLSRRAL